MDFKKNISKKLLGIVVLTIIFYTVFLIYSDVNAIIELFLEINLWIVPIIIMFRMLSILIRSFRQKYFLDVLDVKVSLKFNFLLYLSGLSMLITPGSSGTIIKSYILKKKINAEYSKTIPVVITEKFHDVLVPIIFISIMLFFIIISNEIQIIAITGSGLILVLYFIVSRKQSLLENILHKTSKLKIINKFQENILDNHKAIQILSNKKPFTLGFILGFGAILLDGIAIYFGFVALGVDYGFISSIVTVYSANILGLLSFVPAGFGVVETSLLGLFLQNGFTLAIASSMVLITRLSSAWLQIILGSITQFYMMKGISDKD